jgi:hypothetical protein
MRSDYGLSKHMVLGLIICLVLMLAAAPTAMAAGETFSTLSVGAWHTMVVKTDGSLWTWGRNTVWQ